MDTILIHHIRPGKKEQLFNEGLVSDSQHGLSTFTNLSEEDSKSLTKRLRSRGFIQSHQIVRSVSKYYPRGEAFNLVVFRDQNGDALGYYSDMAMPIRKVENGYEVVDLFLDLWLKPNGILIELDVDEFQDAASKGIITEEQQKMAITAFERLKEEAKQSIYPLRYIRP